MWNGNQSYELKPKDLEKFVGNRGRKGKNIGRWTKVDKVEVISE